MPLHVLFVDDETNVLNGLRLVLRPLKGAWEMAYAENGMEALEILSEKRFDVIISDMRMPGMDGGDLLSEVQRLYPHMLRIILSGYSDQEMIMKTVKPAHQFLSKPCNHKDLQDTVERSMRLRSVLGNERIRSILSDVDALPSLPEVYGKLEEELRKEVPSLQLLGDLIEQDMGLTASLLKLVNSSFFGLRRHVSSPHQAVVLLGTETVKSLMLIIELVKGFVVDKSIGFSATLLWQHSTHVGHIARCASERLGMGKDVVDHAFIAGLLHDVGKLVLLTRFKSEYMKVLELVRTEGVYVNTAEQQVFGATHAEMGAYLLALWGLPPSVVEAVQHHHAPVYGETAEFGPMAAVHIGNVLERQIHVINAHYEQPKMDEMYIRALGLEGRLGELETMCRELLEDVQGPD